MNMNLYTTLNVLINFLSASVYSPKRSLVIKIKKKVHVVHYFNLIN